MGERLRQPSRGRSAAPVRRRARGGIYPRWRPFHDYIDAVGFEPDPAECDRLNREAASQDRRSDSSPMPWRGRREVTFYRGDWPPASSIYPPYDEFLKPFPYASHLLGTKGRRQISAVSLDEACRTQGVWPGYLKLDVEGSRAPGARGRRAGDQRGAGSRARGRVRPCGQASRYLDLGLLDALDFGTESGGCVTGQVNPRADSPHDRPNSLARPRAPASWR